MTQETILRVLCPFAKESVLACGRGAAGLVRSHHTAHCTLHTHTHTHTRTHTRTRTLVC
jgi:hypothetical protein